MILKSAEQGREPLCVGKLCDCRPGGLNRRQALLFHRSCVHASGIVVAILLLQGSLGVLGCGVQFLPKQISIPLPKQRE